jgi:hypothetical protein
MSQTAVDGGVVEEGAVEGCVVEGGAVEVGGTQEGGAVDERFFLCAQNWIACDGSTPLRSTSFTQEW